MVGRETRRAVGFFSPNRGSAPVLSCRDQGVSIVSKSTMEKAHRFCVGTGVTRRHRTRWVAAQNRRGRIIGKKRAMSAPSFSPYHMGSATPNHQSPITFVQPRPGARRTQDLL